MAAEQDLTLDDGEKAPPAAGSKKKTLLLIIAGSVLLVAVAVGVTLWLLAGDSPASADDAATEAVPAPLLPVQYVIMKPEFVVSFQVGPRQRFLQLSIEVMTRQPAVIDALRVHDPLLRNEIIRIISEHEFDYLRTAEGRIELQRRLQEQVAAVIRNETGVDGVEAVLFTNFVMQ